MIWNLWIKGFVNITTLKGKEMSLADIPEESFDPRTGLTPDETIFIFSMPFDREKEGIPFIYNQLNELTFEMSKEEAERVRREIKEQLNIDIIVWELVPHLSSN